VLFLLLRKDYQLANRKQRTEQAYQPKGEPKDGRKVSRSKITKDDELSSAMKSQTAKNMGNSNNRGGRN
jgi:hypothetical protein